MKKATKFLSLLVVAMMLWMSASKAVRVVIDPPNPIKPPDSVIEVAIDPPNPIKPDGATKVAIDPPNPIKPAPPRV